MQEQHLAREPLLKVTAEHVPELGELREAQRLVALGERLGQDLLKPRECLGDVSITMMADGRRSLCL